MSIRINIREHFNKDYKVFLLHLLFLLYTFVAEFIEAYTLYNYLLSKRLITHDEVQKYLTFDEIDAKYVIVVVFI
jgi:hypothetical protein